MQKKHSGPIIASALAAGLGIGLLFFVNNFWTSQTIAVNNPIVNKIESSSQSSDLKSIIHEAEKSVVQIEGQNEYSTVTGSGFIFNDKGDIITNAHVVKDADVIYVRTANARVYPAAIVGMGEETDIAVIRVPELAGHNALTMETQAEEETGDEVIALGSPHGFQNTVTLGIISGTDRDLSVDGFTYDNAYQISARITHGNSGGPLISRETGKVIGINSVGTEDGTIGFSIPVSEIIDKVTKWSNEVQNEQLDFASSSEIGDDPESDQILESAEYLTTYFLDSLEIRDYVAAYTLLGSSMQLSTSYSDFRDGYTHLTDLEYAELSSKLLEDNQVEVTLDVTVKTKRPENVETKTTRFTFIIGHENNQLKILSVNSSEEKQ